MPEKTVIIIYVGQTEGVTKTESKPIFRSLDRDFGDIGNPRKRLFGFFEVLSWVKILLPMRRTTPLNTKPKTHDGCGLHDLICAPARGKFNSYVCTPVIDSPLVSRSCGSALYERSIKSHKRSSAKSARTSAL